ncbi:MAG TPA: HlyD family efflux transporter periplasmic adaptor subunit [Burkholderiales bacterium]|nr:HlyD family efflux transporter periplasmic adaptor subunit [Burkholderiales bacterium]
MRATLFRREAVDFASERPLGDVALIRPFSSAFLTAGAVILALALLAFAFWGEYTHKAHVAGYLAPTKGVIKVYPPAAATVVTRQVKEGQRVTRGDPLFVLSTDHGSLTTPEVQAAAIAQLQQRRDSLKNDLAQQRNIAQIEQHSLAQRVSSMEQEAIQVKGQLATQHARVKSAQATVARHQALLAQKFVSEALMQQKQEELLDQQARLQALERNRVSLERDLGALRLEIDSSALKAETQRQSIERDISQLEQQLTEYEAKRALVIAAPADGIVTTVLAEEGQNATTTTPLLSILPADAELEAQLLVPSRSIGFISVNQTVALRYQAFPYQRFGTYRGRVIEISKTLINSGDTTLPVPLQESAYRVTVALDSQSVNAYQKQVLLQAGMLLDADVLLDHRRLIEWVFDPLYSLTRRI